jgi:cyanophycin synthetase
MRFSGSTEVLRRASKLRRFESFIQRRNFSRLREEFYDRLWRETAEAVGAECVKIAGGLQRIQRDDMATFVRRSDIMLDNALMPEIVSHKALTYELLAAKGYKVPRHCVVALYERARAEDFLRRLGAPAVVKPAWGTGGGHGVTTAVNTRAKLRRAARYAASYNPIVLVEEFLPGSSFRLLYLDGDFIDAVRRDPPIIVGDGKHAIRELVQQENRRRRKDRPITALSPLLINQDCRNHLAQKGMSPASRPKKSEIVEVKGAVNENSASQNHNVRQDVHNSIIKAGEKIVSEIGVRFAGVDIFAHTLSEPMEESGAIFGEINANPGIHHHYLLADPAKGEAVAERILDYLFTRRVGVITL